VGATGIFTWTCSRLYVELVLVVNCEPDTMIPGIRSAPKVGNNLGTIAAENRPKA
jgi:hypothetical protein